MRVYRRFGKRLLDVAAAGLGLVVLSPVLGVTAVRVRRHLGSPVLFRQVRPGQDGRPFVLIKFRSMTEAPAAGVAAPSDEEEDELRLTTFGRKLRSSSLDELPELWNILRGDMSLVGPRPLLVDYLEMYSDQQARRHEVKPGLTGLAQVNGRNALAWTQRLDLDVWYVDNYSFPMDLGLLWRTIKAVVNKCDISGAGSATMTRFSGTSTD